MPLPGKSSPKAGQLVRDETSKETSKGGIGSAVLLPRFVRRVLLVNRRGLAITEIAMPETQRKQSSRKVGGRPHRVAISVWIGSLLPFPAPI